MTRAWEVLLLIVLVCQVGVAAFYFSIGHALALVGLALLARYHLPGALSLLFLAISFDWVRPVFGGMQVAFTEIELSVVCLVFLWMAKREAPVRRISFQVMGWGAGFLVAVLISALINNEWYRVVPHLLRISEFVVCLWLSHNVFRNDADRSFLKVALIGALASHSIFSYYQYWAGFHPIVPPRVPGLFGNPNQFGAYLNLLLPFALCFLWFENRIRGCLLWLDLLLLGLVASLAAQSRSGLVALVLGFFILWASLRFVRPAFLGRISVQVLSRLVWSNRLLIVIHLFLACLLLVAFVRSPLPGHYFANSRYTLVGRAQQFPESQDIDARLGYYHLGLLMLRDHWLTGIGPGNQARIVPRYRDTIEPYIRRSSFLEERFFIDHHLHNLYLQMAVDFGLLGLAAFLFLIVKILVTCFCSRSQSPWKAAGFYLFATLLLYNLFDVTIPSLAMETGLLLGATLPATSK